MKSVKSVKSLKREKRVSGKEREGLLIRETREMRDIDKGRNTEVENLILLYKW